MLFCVNSQTAVQPACDNDTDGGKDELELLGDLEKVSKVEMPKAICDILDAEVLHTRECDADKMEEEVKKILGL